MRGWIKWMEEGFFMGNDKINSMVGVICIPTRVVSIVSFVL